MPSLTAPAPFSAVFLFISVGRALTIKMIEPVQHFDQKQGQALLFPAGGNSHTGKGVDRLWEISGGFQIKCPLLYKWRLVVAGVVVYLAAQFMQSVFVVLRISVFSKSGQELPRAVIRSA